MNLYHPCARAVKIFTVWFQFLCMYCEVKHPAILIKAPNQ